MQISGLWPFAYDLKAKKFKFLWYFTVTPIIVIGYPIVVALFWSKKITSEINVKHTFVLLLLVTFLICNSINFVIMFVNHYIKFKEIKTIILKGNEVIAELKNELDSSEFRYEEYLLKFIFKAVILMCLLTYSILQSMERFSKLSDDYVFHIMSVLPNLIVKLHSDAFFAGLLLAEFYLSRINDKVSGLLTTAKDLSENNDLDEQKCYQKMIDFCRLSDVLDRLCILQCNGLEICERFVRHFSFQITLSIALALMVLLINLFHEYISITTRFRNDEFSVTAFVNDLLGAGLVMVEIYMISTTSDSLMIEVGCV